MAIYKGVIIRGRCPILCGVTFAIPNSNPLQNTQLYTALVDTGSNQTLVGQEIIDALGLITHNWINPDFRSANNTEGMPMYDNITIILPSDKRFTISVGCSGINYSTPPNPAPFQIAIGMDILKDGLFIVNGINNSYILDLP